MEKSPEAFRTISEVADWLDVPTHVLRFWESRFKQVKPVKRAGGRRYYRPSDMALIGGIKVLLHDEGMTIRGVQKLLREKGIRHVAGHAPGLTDDEGHTVIEAEAIPVEIDASEPEPANLTDAPEPDTTPEPDVEDAEVLDLFSESEVAEEAATDEPEAAAFVPPQLDIPESDPEDDDAAHEVGHGIAFRLRTSDPAVLGKHHADLAALRDRLAALRDRIAGT